MKNTELKKLLKKNERSQAWLARKLNVTSMTVNYWYNGINNIPEKKIEEIEGILNNE